MRASCPACGAEMTLDAMIAFEAAREAVRVALLLPSPLGKLLIQYLALFRPAKRQLSWERVASLLQELATPLAEAKLERSGRLWPAPLGYWEMALTEMLAKRDKLTLPLKSHGYLLEILASQAEKTAAKAETGGKGKSVYDSTCTVCHGTGVAGAPKFGDKAAWAPRIKTGMDTLYSVALKGKGAMPTKGGNTALADDDVKAAVDYMVGAAK